MARSCSEHLYQRYREAGAMFRRRKQIPDTAANLCVYVIGFEDQQFHGVVKIGVTNNIAKRLATLQTGNPWRLEVKALVYRTDAFQYEAALHEYFDKQRMRMDGEWFDFGVDSDPPAIISEART